MRFIAGFIFIALSICSVIQAEPMSADGALSSDGSCRRKRDGDDRDGGKVEQYGSGCGCSQHLASIAAQFDKDNVDVDNEWKNTYKASSKNPGSQATPLSPEEALEALIEGNKRYREGKVELRDYSPKGERSASSQAPFASILSCADSRVSPSLIFDVDSGNIFQVRLAGNVVDIQARGSLEFSVAVLKVPLIVVMGHTDCGAVASAIRAYKEDPEDPRVAFPPKKFGAISAVCRAIYPAVSALSASKRTVPRVTVKNVALQVKKLTEAAPVLEDAIREGKLLIVGAEYIISDNPKIDGLVKFFLCDQEDLEL